MSSIHVEKTGFVNDSAQDFESAVFVNPHWVESRAFASVIHALLAEACTLLLDVSALDNARQGIDRRFHYETVSDFLSVTRDRLLVARRLLNGATATLDALEGAYAKFQEERDQEEYDADN